MTNVNNSFATAAAREFTRQYSATYIPNKRNSELMSIELARLVTEEGADANALDTYRQAYQNLYSELELKEPESPPTPDEMSPEALATLSPQQQEKLSDRNFRRLANWELEQRSKKPVLSEEDETLRQLFGGQGFADSNENKSVIYRWLTSRGLECSPDNITAGILENESSLAPSEQALSEMPSGEYRKIVEAEFRKRQAAQPKRESPVPFGVKFTEWLHNR